VRNAMALGSILFITACSHPLEIDGEGDILSSSGNRDCLLEDFAASQTNCTENNVVGEYDETYFAAPRTGWQFEGWENYCTDSVVNECSFSVSSGTVFQFWGETVPALIAVFTPIATGMPVTDTIIANGFEWAQVEQFDNLSWNDINAVCSGGPCAPGGVLKGYDMTGWNWASVNDVNALFNFYLGSPFPLGPGPDTYSEPDAAWVGAFYADGWEETILDFQQKTLIGWVRDPLETNPLGAAHTPLIQDALTDGFSDTAQTIGASNKTSKGGYLGAWLYRSLP